MAIFINNNIFVLETKNTHYVIGIDKYGNSHNVHWGKKCRFEDYAVSECEDENSNHTMLDRFRQEYTPFGNTMYRECTLKATFSDGCREIALNYKRYKVGENTLSLIFEDTYYPFRVMLNYAIFKESDIIVRSVTVENSGKDEIIIEKLMSGEVSLPGAEPYRIMNTNGAWGAEFIKTDELLEGGSFVFESRRGTSRHNNSPYFIAHRGADEKRGEVFFANLMWSGSFKVDVSRDLFGVTRAILGMNNFDFEYALCEGERFTTPEIIMGRSEGFGEMSRMLNRFGLDYVLPKTFAKKPLKVLYNSWEATNFNVNVADQTELAKRAARAGCELFVMDDGWFGQRKDDHAGLGDWYVNKEKFPNGLGELIKNVNDLGMDFGLWVEPEMVNPDSDLYHAHPDWAYHYPTRKNNELRWQLVLNMTKKEVKDYIYNCLDSLLSENNIKYIKWDMNRPFSETGGENLEHPRMLWYLHTKAVYDIVDNLKAKHPDVQFESCSSGGGRCDWGALEHFDQVWTSDNTDAVDRIVIQKGYAMTRPVKTMRAWVTDVESDYSRRSPLDFRFNIAMRGALGLGGNLLNYSKDDIALCRKYVNLYKEIRHLVQFGNLYRLLDNDKDEISADMYVNNEKSEAVLFIAAVNTRCFKKEVPLYFDGLDENKVYSFDFDNEHFEKGGAYLSSVGINLQVRPQYYNKIIRITEVVK